MERQYGLLMVDDEPAARKYALSRLQWERLGITRRFEAGSGLKALEIMEREHPEIVILDIRMPEMDGISLLKEICRRQYNTRIIGLSGYSDFDAARAMLSSQKVVEYLLKPVSVDELFEAVTRALEAFGGADPDSLRQNDGEIGARIAYERKMDSEEEAASKEKGDSQISARQAAIIREVKDFLEQNYKEKISLEQAAAHVYMNPSYLSRLFAKAEGCGVSQYLQKIRVEQAKLLLKDPHLRVYEVGDQVGYPNFQHFLKVFKQYAGVTPSRYRETVGWFPATPDPNCFHSNS